MKSQKYCFCGSKKEYQACCEPLHNETSKASSCEQLMRSRFSAFILQKGAYLFHTYHPNFRGDLTIEQFSEPSLNWVNLDIISSETLDETGFVEFKAWYLEDNKLACHHEKSNFVKNEEQWLYCDGEFYPVNFKEIKRNDLCPCGSEKKYKKCCL